MVSGSGIEVQTDLSFEDHGLACQHGFSALAVCSLEATKQRVDLVEEALGHCPAVLHDCGLSSAPCLVPLHDGLVRSAIGQAAECLQRFERQACLVGKVVDGATDSAVEADFQRLSMGTCCQLIPVGEVVYEDDAYEALSRLGAAGLMNLVKEEADPPYEAALRRLAALLGDDGAGKHIKWKVKKCRGR